MPFILLTDETPIMLVSVSPVAGESEAELGGIEVVWEELAPADDPIDTDLFTISRNGIDYPVSFSSIGSNQYRVLALTTFFPFESVIITATATTEDGYEESETWSFSTRLPFGEVRGLGDLNNLSGARNPILAELPRFQPSHSRQTSELLVQSFVASVNRALIENRGMFGHSRQIAHALMLSYGFDRNRAQVVPGFQFQQGADLVRGRLTVVNPFIDPAALGSIEVGIPTESMSDNSIELEEQRLVAFATSMLVAFFGELDRTGFSHEVKQQLMSAFIASMETGLPVLAESMHALDTEEGEGFDVWIDLLSEVFGGARE